MGMGKTVITLSLILANPAPVKGPDLSAQAASDHWGTFCPGQTAVAATIAAMPKSRGTLVVSNPDHPTHPNTAFTLTLSDLTVTQIPKLTLTHILSQP